MAAASLLLVLFPRQISRNKASVARSRLKPHCRINVSTPSDTAVTKEALAVARDEEESIHGMMMVPINQSINRSEVNGLFVRCEKFEWTSVRRQIKIATFHSKHFFQKKMTMAEASERIKEEQVVL